jgi:tetratricopeptide (TPR) repeat protein
LRILMTCLVIFLVPAVLAGEFADTESLLTMEKRLDFEGALEGYRVHVDKHPDDREAMTRYVHLADALGKPAMVERAADQALLVKNPSGWAEWTLLAAKKYEKQGAFKQAGRLYRRLMGEKVLRVGLIHRMAARLGLARALHAEGRANLVSNHLGFVVKMGKSSQGEEREAVQPIMAEAAFRLGALRCSGLDWSMPGRVGTKQLANLLKRKMKDFHSAERALAETFAYRQPKWSAAAALETGRLYRRFVDWILSFPRPATLSPEQEEIYQQSIESMMDPIHQKSCQAFRMVVDHVANNHVGARYGAAAREALDEMGDTCRDSHFPWHRMKLPAFGEFLDKNQAERMVEKAKEALSTRPDDSAALLLAARGLWAGGRAEQAAYVLEWLLPASKERTLLLARVFETLQRNPMAFELAARLVAFSPDHLRARANLARLCFSFGDLAGAAKQLAALEHKETQNAAWHLAHGVAAFGLGQVKEARSRFEKVLKLDPRMHRVRFNLGVLERAMALHWTSEASWRDIARQRIEFLQMAVAHFDAYRRLAGSLEGRDRELVERTREELGSLEKGLGAAAKLENMVEKEMGDKGRKP